jgi:putative membrane protein
MKLAAYLMALFGLGLFTVILLRHGVGEIATALGVAGWGLVWVALFHLLPMTADSLGWRVLFGAREPDLRTLVWVRWIGEGVNGLLPVGQVGGDLVKARLIMQAGMRGSVAGATVVADTTLGLVTQILFTLLGIGLLLLYLGKQEVISALFLGLSVSIVLVGGFYYAQRRGLFGALVRSVSPVLTGDTWLNVVGGAEALDRAIEGIYQQRRALLRAGMWRFLGWLLGAGEVWLIMYCLGVPVSLMEALILESLGCAIRAAAFVIPSALGVQEAGYVFLGTLLGLSSDLSLVLSLAKRVRELLLGIPGLLAWQVAEGRLLFRRRAEQAGDTVS